MSETMRVTYYKQESRRESRNARTVLAAKQFAGRNGYDSFSVDILDYPMRYYILYQSEGRRWHGPMREAAWLRQYWGLEEPEGHSG